MLPLAQGPRYRAARGGSRGAGRRLRTEVCPCSGAGTTRCRTSLRRGAEAGARRRLRACARQVHRELRRRSRAGHAHQLGVVRGKNGPIGHRARAAPARGSDAPCRITPSGRGWSNTSTRWRNALRCCAFAWRRRCRPERSVLMDGATLDTSLLARGVLGDPGPHLVEMRAPGREDRRYEVTLAEGTTLEVTVEPGPPRTDFIAAGDVAERLRARRRARRSRPGVHRLRRRRSDGRWLGEASRWSASVPSPGCSPTASGTTSSGTATSTKRFATDAGVGSEQRWARPCRR